MQFEIHYSGSHSAHNGKRFDVTAIDAAEAVELLREWLNNDCQPIPVYIRQDVPPHSNPTQND